MDRTSLIHHFVKRYTVYIYMAFTICKSHLGRTHLIKCLMSSLQKFFLNEFLVAFCSFLYNLRFSCNKIWTLMRTVSCHWCRMGMDSYKQNRIFRNSSLFFQCFQILLWACSFIQVKGNQKHFFAGVFQGNHPYIQIIHYTTKTGVHKTTQMIDHFSGWCDYLPGSST